MRQAALKTAAVYARLRSVASQTDFYGISRITSKDIAGGFSDTKLDQNKVASKYHLLLAKRDRYQNEQTETKVTFGSIRLDTENRVINHGQFEPDNTKRLFNTSDVTQAFELNESDTQINEETLDEPQAKDPAGNDMQNNISSYNPPYRISEVSPLHPIGTVFNFMEDLVDANRTHDCNNQPPLTFRFCWPLQYSEPSNPITESFRQENEKLAGGCLNEDELIQVITDPMNKSHHGVRTLDYDSSKDILSTEDVDSMSDMEDLAAHEAIEDRFDESLEKSVDPDSKPTKQTSAHQYVKQIRSRRIEPVNERLKLKIRSQPPSSIIPITKLDSKGFNDYTYQVPNWSSIVHKDVLNYLRQSIIYNNYDILAINKPYGIPSYNVDSSNDKFDMNNLLQELAEELKFEKLYLAHRLDKTTTGVLIFATSKERARSLNKQFKASDIKKKYWCITKGVPELEQAILDMPIGTQCIMGKSRMFPVTTSDDERRQLAHKFREARRAVTEYKVLKTVKDASLIEVQPRTGVKHQIRCHLGFGLGIPILGDHKYSHVGKLAPQSLPVVLLNTLHLRRSKVRTLPIHLHAKSIMIPGAKANGESLFINAPLPPHFNINMRCIGLVDDHIKSIR